MASQDDFIVVGEAASANEALKQVAELKPDVVLLDISMPGMTGIEALPKLKKIWSKAAYLLLTMHDDEHFFRKSLQLGASGYVIKHAAERELLDAIRTVASGEMFIQPDAVKILVESIKKQADQRHAEKNPVLTEREVQVLKLVARGYKNREIGEELDICTKTVETHRAKISKKLKIDRQAELIRYALDNGYLD